MKFSIVTYYHFAQIPEHELETLEQKLYLAAGVLDMRGLIILAPEGINSTMCGSEKSTEEWQKIIAQVFKTDSIVFKKSYSDIQAFRRLRIKQRSEIVTLRAPEKRPTGSNHHLSPEEWHRVLSEEAEQITLIDTRNWYETRVGTFKGALDPQIDKFTDLAAVAEQSIADKSKKILMFCTGGIRCEKAILDFQDRGFTNVYQLEGGILNYLQKYPNGHFEGECFVFDHRVAVDQNLQPTQTWALCPHTGQPGSTEIVCARCGTPAKLSEEAVAFADARSKTCSKNCAHHWTERPGVPGARQEFEFDIPPLIPPQITQTL